MKKLLLITITLLSSLLLFSCGDNSDIPEGMQIIDGSEEQGYIFYAPEEWTRGEKMGELAYAYVSRTNKTSVSLLEIDKSTFVKPDPSVSDKDFFLGSYFDSLASEFPESIKYEKQGEKTLLGQGDTAANGAVKYAYSYLYENAYSDTDQRFGFIQILAHRGDRFYIITYSSPMSERSDGQTYYDVYLDKFYEIVDNFKFYDAEKKENEKKEYSKDGDGDIIATDEKLAGFLLSVPRDFEIDYSSAIISATHADGSNITMTKATATGTSIGNYWEFRQKQLGFYVDDLTETEALHAIEISNAENVAACEYTYIYNGRTYKVYQVFFISPGLIKSGYVFTYTSSNDNYSSHIDDINRILAKVKF